MAHQPCCLGPLVRLRQGQDLGILDLIAATPTGLSLKISFEKQVVRMSFLF